MDSIYLYPGSGARAGRRGGQSYGTRLHLAGRGDLAPENRVQNEGEAVDHKYCMVEDYNLGKIV